MADASCLPKQIYNNSRHTKLPIYKKVLRQKVLMPAHYQATQLRQFFEPWERRAERYEREHLIRPLDRIQLSGNCNSIENTLSQTNRASLLASLEVRVPFLDNQVLDRIVPLPAEKKIVNGRLKVILFHS